MNDLHICTCGCSCGGIRDRPNEAMTESLKVDGSDLGRMAATLGMQVLSSPCIKGLLGEGEWGEEKVK